MAFVIGIAVKIYLNREDPALAHIFLKINLNYALIFPVHIISLYLFGQYSQRETSSYHRSPLQIILSVLFSGLILAVLLYFLPKYIIGRQILIYHLIISAVFLILWRSLFYNIGNKWIKSKTIGIAAGIESVEEMLLSQEIFTQKKYIVESILCFDDFEENKFKFLKTPRVFNNFNDFILSSNTDILVIDTTDNRFTDSDLISSLKLKFQGVNIYDYVSFYKYTTGKASFCHIRGNVLAADTLRVQFPIVYSHVKRLIDLLGAVISVLILSPVMLMIALAIKIESPGNVFFSPITFRREIENCSIA